MIWDFGYQIMVAVNHKCLKRRWIGMDITYQSVALILKRFKNAKITYR